MKTKTKIKRKINFENFEKSFNKKTIKLALIECALIFKKIDENLKK